MYGKAWFKTSNYSYVWAIALALLIAMLLLQNPFYLTERLVITLGHLVLSIVFAGLLVCLVEQRDGNLRFAKITWLKTLGKYSYGIYIWHWLILSSFGRLFLAPDLKNTLSGFVSSVVWFCALLALSICSGWTSWHIVERPFLQMKDHFSLEQRTGSLNSVIH